MAAHGTWMETEQVSWDPGQAARLVGTQWRQGGRAVSQGSKPEQRAGGEAGTANGVSSPCLPHSSGGAKQIAVGSYTPYPQNACGKNRPPCPLRRCRDMSTKARQASVVMTGPSGHCHLKLENLESE
ncbi:hypothetical protein E2C01_070127 [Portunus trituberculatus]|uniref:Uncharacterized protein n=1 Tax=Portunus trituberculatus TaxID=210409 RepID=A0A5B7I0H6_PORTR|nr:hypothetical protein [Portunus trituberculatus]